MMLRRGQAFGLKRSAMESREASIELKIAIDSGSLFVVLEVDREKELYRVEDAETERGYWLGWDFVERYQTLLFVE